MHRSIAIAFFATALSGCKGDDNVTNPGSAPSADLRVVFSHGTCQGSGVVRYAALPMAIADVGEFTPLGTMTGAHVTPVDHQYLYPLDLSAGRTRYNVYAPFTGNIVLIQPRVKQAGDLGTAPVGSVDYRVMFEGSCTYWVYYDLMTQLEPTILTAGGSALVANNEALVRIPVTAGQLVGRVGGQSLDLGTVNADISLPGLLVPAHYIAEPWKVHSMDAVDYFDEPLRSQLLAKNKRTSAPLGGKIDFDVDGTASGNWFLLGTNGYGGLTGEGGGNYWAGHLSLARGNVDPALLVFSMGFPNGASQQWTIKGNAPDPATITAANGVVLYQLTRWAGDSVSTNANQPVVAALLVQVLAGRQLRVEYVPNYVASAVLSFSSLALTYER
jgi:hypothetical protein